MKKLLLQLDSDRHPSVFDRVVGHDAGADDVMSYGGIAEGDVRDLVYGTIFTRGLQDLRNTAVFIGGADATKAEHMLKAAQKAFFGPFRVSVMLDPNGSNTTAAAAVVKLVRAMGGDVKGRRAVVLAGTGPVGARAAGLLARAGASVRITSRDDAKGRAAVEKIKDRFGVTVSQTTATEGSQLREAASWAELLLASGPAGAQLLAHADWATKPDLRAVADVNAVPPLGVEGVKENDDGKEREGKICFGALGIGGLKMKVHKAAVARLFEKNDQIMDAEAIYDLAATL